MKLATDYRGEVVIKGNRKGRREAAIAELRDMLENAPIGSIQTIALDEGDTVQGVSRWLGEAASEMGISIDKGGDTDAKVVQFVRLS